MFCSQCGARNEDGATRCAQCGATLAAVERAAMSGPDAAVAPVTSAKATWSCVLGVLSLLCLLTIFAGLPAIILGALALADIRRSAGRLKGEGQAMAGIILGVVGSAAGVFAMVAIADFLEAQARSKVAYSRSDMRSLATALEAYHVDNEEYPPALAPWLTSPIVYVTANLTDPFSGETRQAFRYSRLDEGRGWILYSAGPDGVYDIDPAGDLDAGSGDLLTALVDKTFDPTNGTTSRGDIWRSN